MKQIVWEAQKYKRNLVGHAIVELLIKTIFCMFWSITQEPIHCKNYGVKFNTPGVVREPHQVGVNFNTSRC